MANDKDCPENSNGSIRLSSQAVGRTLVVLLFALTAWALANTVKLMVDVGRIEERLAAIERDIADGKDVDREQWRRFGSKK